jgi:hypothetical protein
MAAKSVVGSSTPALAVADRHAAAERIAGVLADRGIDVSGRTISRWDQKFGAALAKNFGVIGICRSRRGRG